MHSFIFFYGTKVAPTLQETLSSYSPISKEVRKFLRSCSMLEEHEERVIQCSCIFAFHSFIARRHDQFLVIHMVNQLSSFYSQYI